MKEKHIISRRWVKNIWINLMGMMLLMSITQVQAAETIEGTANRTNATPIETNINHTLLPTHNNTYKGTPQKYGYYSFVVAENTQARIIYTAPNDGGSWLSLRKENGSKIKSTWIVRNTTGTLGPVTLEAGSYHFIVNKNGAAEKTITLKVNLANDGNGDGGDNTAEGIIGTQNKHNATAIEVNKKQTLLPTHPTAYKGIPQKYGYYSFKVPKNSEATMSYTAPDDGGSWISLRNSNGSKITNKWIAKGSIGTVGPMILTSGNYYFIINKNGSALKTIDVKVNLANSDNGDGGDDEEEGIEGSKKHADAIEIPVNKDLALLPLHDTSYKGKTQKYGFYRFTVPSNTEATITYTAPSDNGSYLELFEKSKNHSIVDKWIAKATTGTVGPLTLTAGSYYFYLNKDGGLAKHISLRVSLSDNSDITELYKILPIEGKKYFGAMPSFSDEDNIPLGKKGRDIIRDFDVLAGHEATWTYMADHWGVNKLQYPKAKISMILSTDKIPFVRMMPLKGTSGVSPMEINATYNGNMTYPLKEIATNSSIIGKIRAWAKAAKDHYEESARNGKPFYLMLDFAPEMNGYWFQWGGAHQNPNDYKAAYRKIIDIFREEKVPHVTWVFHPVLTEMEWYKSKKDEGLTNFEYYENWAEPKNYYPGDSYIDWVGFSIYGRDKHIAKKSDDYYPSFDEKLKKDKGRIFDSFSPHKPRMVAEFAVIEKPGDPSAKPIWLTNALESISKHGKIYAMTYWNQSWKDDDGHPINMSIGSSLKSKKAFNNALNEIELVNKSEIPIAE